MRWEEAREQFSEASREMGGGTGAKMNIQVNYG